MNYALWSNYKYMIKVEEGERSRVSSEAITSHELYKQETFRVAFVAGFYSKKSPYQ